MATSLSTPQGSTSILDLMIAVQSDTHIGDPISSRTRSGDVTRCPAKSQEQSDAINSDAQEQKQKKQVFKKRKATHTLRKEEKEALEVEVQVLKAKLDALKLQALVQRDDTDSTLNRRIAHNTVLREVVQKQHVVLAHTQGMLVGCAQRHSYEVRPTEMYIHLTADRYERHETLKALREHKLFYARRFIQQRSLGMHPTAEYLHEERYETPEGDYCNVRFDRVPLRGVRGGIRAVLDALKQAAFNAEIIISETSGNLTIREDDDLAEKDCSQLRLVTQTNRGVLLENNLVHFTDFSSAGGSDSYAITTTDFVDEDELLPYLPDQRVRRDATTAILVTSHADTQSDDVDGPAHTKKRVYKKRKSTHTVRKEERLALEEELETLKTKLDALKLRALIHSGDEAASLHKQMAQNSGLQESIQEHHLVVANAQAMLVSSTQPHSNNVRPTETYIHLTLNPVERRAALGALRELKLECAKQFIQQRSAGLHPTADYFIEERYETPEGDFCNVRFDRTALRRVTGGVHAVFEALKRAVFNAEIVLSEASGNITIREDDDMDEMDNFSQMKLVTETTQGILVENNLVHFSDYIQEDGEQSYALATADFVNEDDLFPYRSHERIRRDATSVILVTSHLDTSSNELVVVMTRWTFTRICGSNLDIPTQILREMRDRSGHVSETILNCVRETLNLPK
ncbi:uncharacterized protein KRP23_14040 [Phytophthora ramorum]|uniref:uncharacterized protein n=1 Tax=Phytophthora ramorum TaxID=164328 RepID=UPI0030B526CC|nr:hypothetical protein KRP23_14040 [Phytophthora ramorum]